VEAQQEFERRLRWSMALPLVLGGLLAAVLLAELQYLVGVNRWVDHTDQVIVSADRIVRLLVDMDMGLRGYLLIGREELLAPYHEATREFDTRLAQLRELVKDNPQQVERLGALAQRYRGWRIAADRQIAQPPFSGPPGYQAYLPIKAVMDAMRSEMDAFTDVEVRLRDERTARARGAYGRVVGGAVSVAILAGLLLALFVRRQLLVVSGAYRSALSERERAEEGLIQLNHELESRVLQRTEALSQANEELEAFSYSVSHDLRAPLRAIDGFSQVLQEEAGERLDSESQDALRRIRAATQRMGRLIDELLMLSRVGRSEFRRAEVDVSAVVRSIEAELRAREPQRAVSLEVAPGLVANADPRLLRIALTNLLDNAWKFTRRTKDARIQVRVETSGAERVYAVSDNGAGFDMAYANKLFAPFQRLHRDAEFEGTGIGLATVRRIIQRHGGRIWAEAEAGRGATFRFTLGEQ